MLLSQVYIYPNKTLLGWNLRTASNVNEIIVIAKDVHGDVKIFQGASVSLAALFGTSGVAPERLFLVGIDGNRLNISYEPQGGTEKSFDFQAVIENGKLGLCAHSVREEDQ